MMDREDLDLIQVDMTVVPMSLERLLAPATVALIGASGTPGKWGYMMMRTLLDGGFGGQIAAVNGRGGEVQGHPAYPTVADLPWAPDVALVTVGREACVDAVEALAARGCRHAVLYAAGFAELGAEGARLQDRMVAGGPGGRHAAPRPELHEPLRRPEPAEPDRHPGPPPGAARLRVPERQPRLRPGRARAPERPRAVPLPEPRQPGRPRLRGRAGRRPRGSRYRRRGALRRGGPAGPRPGVPRGRPSPGARQARGGADRRADGHGPPRVGVPHRGAPVRRPRAARDSSARPARSR